LDPIVSITPPDAVVKVDGARTAVADGKAVLRVPPRQRVEVSLSRGGEAKMLTLDRQALAELNYALTLPSKPLLPTPTPEPTPAPLPLAAEFDAEEARAAQEAWAKSLGIKVFWKNSLGMEMALVPPGRFTIGADPADPLRGAALPAQPATVDTPFSISTTEVTQAQWYRVMETRPWAQHQTDAGDDFPAVYVSWDEASEFCRRLTAIERAAGNPKSPAYRLPTESEWEWACRAGSTGRFTCPDTEIARYGWFDRNIGANANIRRVAQLAPNRFGLFDVHGNAAEWCADVFISRVGAARAPAPEKAILRGGGWDRTAPHIASASRDSFPRGSSNKASGFRVAIDP
jgi:formylglycine-generating enzyme required for sulfatase activity